MGNPICYFNCSPEFIRLMLMICVRSPLSLRRVDDILFARGIDNCHETVRFWWSRFVLMFAPVIRNVELTTGHI